MQQECAELVDEIISYLTNASLSPQLAATIKDAKDQMGFVCYWQLEEALLTHIVEHIVKNYKVIKEQTSEQSEEEERKTI